MTTQNFSYVLFEIAWIFIISLIIFSLGAISTLATKRFLSVVVGLYAIWITWDFIAISFGVFHFPDEGSLPARIFNIPIEEHLFFVVHSYCAWALVLIADFSKKLHG